MSTEAETGRLQGVTVVWIGSVDAAVALLDALALEGARVERLPLIEFAPPKNTASLKNMLADMDRYSWIAFTSLQAVRTVSGYSKPDARIAAVGPGTANQLKKQGWEVDLVPTRHDAEGLCDALLADASKIGSLLFVRGDQAGRALPTRLANAGFEVVEVEVYSTRSVNEKRAKEVLDRIVEVANLVIAGSSSGVMTLKNAATPRNLGEIKHGLKWLCLGRKTRDDLLGSGVEHAVFPGEITPEAVVESAIGLMCEVKEKGKPI